MRRNKEMSMNSKDFGLKNIDPMDVFCLDTETTGLGDRAEVCQLSIYRLDGKLVFDELIKTIDPIPKEVTEIHGISNSDIEHKQSMNYWWSYLSKNFFTQKIVLGYNVFFDIRLLIQSASRTIDCVYFSPTVVIDVMMLAASEFNNGKFMRLENACKAAKIDVSAYAEDRFHDANFDTRMTLELFKKIRDIA
jgi:DNA polymerase-3 subunit epsilon